MALTVRGGLSALALLALGCGQGSDDLALSAGSVGDPAPVSLPFSLPPDAEGAEDDFSSVMRWLLADGYGNWERESEVRTSTQGPNGVRIFLSPSLTDSLARGAASHPVGAIAVRELYAEDLETRHGFALAIKIDEGVSAGERAWYWLQVAGLEEDSAPLVAGLGATACVGCHSDGVDYIRSPYPLP